MLILLSFLTLIESLQMSSLDLQLQRFKALPLRKQRSVACIVGAAVADAATRPTHWVYDTSKLASILDNKNPEFWPVNLSPFYSIPTSRRSCYNDVCYACLRSLPTGESNVLDIVRYKQSLLEMFSPHSGTNASSTVHTVYNKSRISYSLL